MTIADLFARIGLKTDEEKAKSFSRAMNGAKTTMVAATVAATAVSVAITKISSDAVKAAVSLKQFNAETGASTTELQKWQAVAEQTNQSAQVVDSAVRAIAANQEKIKLGQGTIKPYQLLGIDPREDPFEVLEQLREKTVDLSDAMRKNILQEMGVGSGLIQTLSLSREEFDSMASRAFIISPAAIETITKMKSSVDLANRGINYMKAQITVGLSPQIEALTKKVVEFLKANEKGLIQGFQQAFKWSSKFVGAIINTISAIDWAVSGTIGWRNAIVLLAGAFGILNSTLLLSPIGLITAGIILLIAVLDDLYIYSTGGKSMFGKLMNTFPELEEKMFGFLDKLKEVKELFKAFSTGDEMAIDSILDQWGKLGDFIQAVIEGIETLQAIQLSRENVEEAVSTIGTSRDLSTGERMKQAWEQTLDFIPTMLGLKEPGNQTNNITQNVYGTDDPIATGNAAARQLQSSINAASSQRGRNE